MHMSWTTNKKNKLLFLQQMGLWYTNEKCEAGGGVTVAKGLNSPGELESACCSSEPVIKCHYSDKPSVKECQSRENEMKFIDKPPKGRSFW